MPASRPGTDAEATERGRRRGGQGLDWLNFFVANVQTGFGPFIAVYLTAHAWTQGDIGLVLSVAGLVGLVGQVPGGALVDAVRSKSTIASIAIWAIMLSALLLSAWPIFLVVMVAEILHGVASLLLGPAIAAISIGLVGTRELGERLGRNARFAGIGNGMAALFMGLCGSYVSNRSVFILTAVLNIPALLALRLIPSTAPVTAVEQAGKGKRPTLRSLLSNRGLLIFAVVCAFFQLANAAMLPIIAGIVTSRSSHWATMIIAASIVLPQITVALLGPWVGRYAERRGRKPLVIAAFLAVAVRGLLFALIKTPFLVIVSQVFDGVSAAVIGVMMPVIVADLTHKSGHFNISLGMVGLAMGAGASCSTALGGYTVDHFGNAAVFLGLGGIALLGALVTAALLPETRELE